MENIMIDTCVFFKMIEYNNFVMEYGKENLDEYIKHNEDKLLKDKIAIDNFIKENGLIEFLEKNKNLSYIELINKLSNEKMSNIIGSCKKSIDGDTKALDNPAVPQQRKDFLKTKIHQNKQILEHAQDIDKKIKQFKLKIQSIECGKIFKQAIDGKIKLFTNTVSFSEILEHSKQSNKTNWIHFTENEILNLSKNMISIVTTESHQPFLTDDMQTDKTLQAIELLAKAYRQPSDNINEKNMEEDKNTLGDFGDSKIAALANMAGMTLVTINGKDFIYNKDKQEKNEDIRNHINAVNKICPYSTDAQVISIDEFLDGNYKRPSKNNPVCKLFNSQNQEIKCNETFEMTV